MSIDKKLTEIPTEYIVGCFYHALITREGNEFDGDFEIKNNNKLAKLLYAITREDFDKYIEEKTTKLKECLSTKLSLKNLSFTYIEKLKKELNGRMTELSKLTCIHKGFYN